MTYYPPISPYSAGLSAKCPRCGQGPLFRGFLKLHTACSACQLDYAKADAGDGPAVFVIFIVGFIAVGLAFVARWNGQNEGDFPYSVAEHSLLVEQLFSRIVPNAPAKWRLAALLHDAPEYVIGDMISPVKAAVGPGYSVLDDRLTAAIHLRFGLPAAIPKTVKAKIKRADKVSAWLEATQIAGFEANEANKFFGRPDPSLIKGLSIVLRAPVDTRHAFVDRHNALLSEM